MNVSAVPSQWSLKYKFSQLLDSLKPSNLRITLRLTSMMGPALHCFKLSDIFSCGMGINIPIAVDRACILSFDATAIALASPILWLRDPNNQIEGVLTHG